MGEPVCPIGMYTAPASFPVALSYARSNAPTLPDASVKVPLSPAITKVLVVTRPTRPPRPVRGIVTPFSAGLLRILSGVSPCAIDQAISPLSKLIATIEPYGGLKSGNPSTVKPRGKPSPAGSRGPPAAAAGRATPET